MKDINKLILGAILIVSCGCIELLNQVKVEKLVFDKNDEILYLKRAARGLNYEVVVLSSSKNKIFTPDKRQEYVYTAFTDMIFYEVVSDTLKLYVRNLADEPPKFSTNKIIQQIELVL